MNELIMTADLIPAERFHEVGIFNKLVAADALEGRAYKLQSTTFVRAVALSAQDSQWINQLRHDVYSGEDYAEGVTAFHEKRPLHFA